jgi:hypothetical protein
VVLDSKVTCIRVQPSTSCQGTLTDQLNGDLGGEGEDVGAGDDAGASVLQGRLYVVHHGEPPRRADVRVGCLLAAHRRGLVQQQRPVAALHTINVVEHHD